MPTAVTISNQIGKGLAKLWDGHLKQILNNAAHNLASLITFVNEVRTDFNALRTDVSNLKTAHAATVTLANEAKADFNLLRADVSALKTAHAATVTLANEAKADFNLLRTDVSDLPEVALVAGANTATNIAVSGILLTSSLVSVIHHTAGAALADLTAETTITSDGNIQLSATDTSGDQLIVIWKKVLTSTAVAAADTADSAALGSTDIAAADTADSAALTSTTIAAAAVTQYVTTSTDFS